MVEKLRFSILYVTTARGAHKRTCRSHLVNHPDQSFPLWTPRRGRHTRAVLGWSDLSLSFGTLCFPDKLSLRRKFGVTVVLLPERQS